MEMLNSRFQKRTSETSGSLPYNVKHPEPAVLNCSYSINITELNLLEGNWNDIHGHLWNVDIVSRLCVRCGRVKQRCSLHILCCEMFLRSSEWIGVGGWASFYGLVFSLMHQWLSALTARINQLTVEFTLDETTSASFLCLLNISI